MDEQSDLVGVWIDIINNRLKGLGLSRKGQRALVLQLAQKAKFDPAKTLELIAALRGDSEDCEDAR